MRVAIIACVAHPALGVSDKPYVEALPRRAGARVAVVPWNGPDGDPAGPILQEAHAAGRPASPRRGAPHAARRDRQPSRVSSKNRPGRRIATAVASVGVQDG